MSDNDLILADDFCAHYKINYSFISSLQQFGLIEITSVDDITYINYNQLQKLEQLIRLHYDLDINFEGIDAIVNLLDVIRKMQSEIFQLKNRLSLYENV